MYDGNTYRCWWDWLESEIPRNVSDISKGLGVFDYYNWHKWKVLVAQSRPTACDPEDSSPPDSSVRGILRVRILEWGAIPFFRGSSQPRSLALWADSLPSKPPGKSHNWHKRFYDEGRKREKLVLYQTTISTYLENFCLELEQKSQAT